MPDQGEPINKAFLLHLKEAPHSQGLILLGDFKYLDICWKNRMVRSRQSRKLLECIEDNFLNQVIDSSTRRGAILEFMVTKTSELIRDFEIGGRQQWSCTGRVHSPEGHGKSKDRTLNYRKAKFHLFKELVNRNPRELALRDKGEEQSWQIFDQGYFP